MPADERTRRTRVEWGDFETAARWLGNRPGGRWISDLLDVLPAPLILLVGAMGVYAAVFSILLIDRHNNFGTFDYDLGIFDQSVWLLSNGESFITVRGLDFWGHHANLGFYLFVPFYWLGAGPNFLDVAMVLAFTLGAIPLYLLGTRLGLNPWYAIVPSLAYLLHFAGQWTLNETFHPEILAIAPFMMAYLAQREGRWRSFALWLALAMCWKEDVALAVFALGAVMVIRRKVAAGTITMAVAAGWFLIVTQVLIPASTPSGAFYSGFFGPLGNSPFEVVDNAVTNPTLVSRQLERTDGLGYVRDLLAPYGFTSLLSPLTLLIGAPNALINLLNVHGLSANIQAHYVAMPLAAASLAMVEAIAWVKRLSARRFLLGWVAVWAVTTSVIWGVAPYSEDYGTGVWARQPGAHQSLFEWAVTVPGDSDAVATTYNFSPHLTHRSEIYTFPNPWQASNWGIEGEDLPDPAEVDWLLIDRRILGDAVPVLDEVLAGEDWEIVYDDNELLIAKRPDVELTD